MNIKQALKEKNKLVKQIQQAYIDAQSFNSIDEGNTRKYSTEVKLKEAKELTLKLVDLKTRIHKANQPVYDKIFLMAELKGRVNQIKSLNVAEGKYNGGWRNEAPIVKTVEIDIVKRDQMIQEIEEEIEKLQDTLDIHNATTTI